MKVYTKRCTFPVAFAEKIKPASIWLSGSCTSSSQLKHNINNLLLSIQPFYGCFCLSNLALLYLPEGEINKKRNNSTLHANSGIFMDVRCRICVAVNSQVEGQT
jgi:hypothetical protein